MRLMPSRPFHYYSLPLSLLSLGGSIDGGVSQNRLINSPINPTTRYRSGNAACHSGLSVVSRLASGLIFTFFFSLLVSSIPILLQIPQFSLTQGIPPALPTSIQLPAELLLVWCPLLNLAIAPKA